MSAAQTDAVAATGRRKTAVARVLLKPGEGRITVNKRTLEDAFPNASLRQHLSEPLERAEGIGPFDIAVNVRGGGVSGQAGAVRHAIARALVAYRPELRPVLKKSGFLTRDAREKERKKYGQRGARARFQFSKR
jgi:small subunit ribosomal protein S9